MRKTLMVGMALALLAPPAGTAGQQTTRVHEGRGGSPHDRTAWTIDGAGISITYGRPAVKGRDVYGGIVPYGRVWRAGADEATTLVTDRALVFGDLTVPPGEYTLFAWVDDPGPWHLIVNKETGQWGTAYKASEDLGRAEMTTATLPELIEQLTYSIEDTADGGVLHIDWERTRASIPFRVQ